MEQDALAVSTGLQKPYIYPEVHRIYRFYRFYNITDLQIFGRPESYNFSPGAHPRTHAGYNTKRCGEAGALRQVVPTRARARGVAGRRRGAAELSGRGECAASVVQECRSWLGRCRLAELLGGGATRTRACRVNWLWNKKCLFLASIRLYGSDP